MASLNKSCKKLLKARLYQLGNTFLGSLMTSVSHWKRESLLPQKKNNKMKKRKLLMMKQERRERLRLRKKPSKKKRRERKRKKSRDRRMRDAGNVKRREIRDLIWLNLD